MLGGSISNWSQRMDGLTQFCNSVMAEEATSGLQVSTRSDFRCLQQRTGGYLGLHKTRLGSAEDASTFKNEEGSTDLEIRTLSCISLATRMEKQQGKAESPSNAELSRTAPAEGTAASFHLCSELQQLTHPKTGILVYAEPLNHFRALFVFVQYISQN